MGVEGLDFKPSGQAYSLKDRDLIYVQIECDCGKLFGGKSDDEVDKLFDAHKVGCKIK